jgi:hypothetical protein
MLSFGLGAAPASAAGCGRGVLRKVYLLQWAGAIRPLENLRGASENQHRLFASVIGLMRGR